MIAYLTFDSPLGIITLQSNDEGLQGCWFETQTTRPDELGTRIPDHPILQTAQHQLQDYFSGTRTQFDLPLAPKGTEFQKEVWTALQLIPFGQSCSYQALAQQIARPKAMRAVGAANGRNPISIIVPCHRVISRNGKLTGYAGGLERKEWLLAHEGGWSQPSIL